MLVGAAKPSFISLGEAAKQLFIWNCSRTLYSFTRSKSSPLERGKWNVEDIPVKKLNLEDLKPLEKNFYVPHPNVVDRSESAIKSFYEKHDIHLFGNCIEKCPAPIFSFEELDLPSSTLQIIRNMNFSEPTPIQSMTWPIALSGLNMVGIARTGSGKTLGFALPGLLHIKNQPSLERGDGPIVLVVSPTRELAQQTNKVFLQFARSFSFRTACVYGGSSKLHQSFSLERAHVCIGTPGRILDFLASNTTDLRRCTYFVLDEADRLFDMGFEPQIRKIMEQMRPDSQILLWSATWPDDIQDLASNYLKDYIGVRYGSSKLSANPNIQQHIHVCENFEKRDILLKILKEIFSEEDNKTLIFTKTKDMVERLGKFLSRQGYRVECLHGDKSQRHRDFAMSNFRSGRIQILIGTNLIGRGLDISDIKHVINFDFPTTIEDYVHIIGRTGRGDQEGTSHTLFTDEDEKLAKDLVNLLKETNQEVNPDLLKMRSFSRRPRYTFR